MLMKLTEFDGKPIIINSNYIVFIRPSETKDVDAKSFIRISGESEDYDTNFYVKESIKEIADKLTMAPLF